MIRIISLLTALVALQACQTSPDNTAAKPKNVPYAEVVSQRFQIAASNIAYANSNLQRIYYWPAQFKTQSVLIFIHGGCWLNAYDYTHARGLFTALAKQGVATFAIEYRRTGDVGGGWPGTLSDIQQALPAVKQWLDDKSLGDVPVYLAGHSAGGHLALLAAQSVTFPVEKVIGLAAITDPAAYAEGANSCQTATPQFLRSETSCVLLNSLRINLSLMIILARTNTMASAPEMPMLMSSLPSFPLWVARRQWSALQLTLLWLAAFRNTCQW